jgi:hypothetical protein
MPATSDLNRIPSSTALESGSVIVPGRLVAFHIDTPAAVFRASVNVVFTARPLVEAEISAVCGAVNNPAAAANTALLEPAAIDTLAGTLTTALLLDTATESGTAAAPVRDIVQEAELFGARVIGMHDNDES